MASASRLRAANDEVFAVLAGVGHAVSQPARLRLLTLLAQGEKPVAALATGSGESIANTSAHLGVLASAGLVKSRRDGRYIRYSLTGDAVASFTAALCAVGEELSPEVRRIRRETFGGAAVRDITPVQLRHEMRHGTLTLVDLRPADEFESGHLPGARSLPFDQIDAGARALPDRRALLAYCRGPYCVHGVEAIARVRRGHPDAALLPFGVIEWRAAGFALEYR